MSEDQFFCPSCDTDTEHTIVKFGQENLMRCTQCKMIHPILKEREQLIVSKVIVSHDQHSSTYRVLLPAKDELHVGDELLVDDPARDIVMTEITSLETGKRVNTATVEAVKTIWARAVDRVPLKISIFRRGKTMAYKQSVPGEEIVSVGEVRETNGIKFSVIKIKLRQEGFADTAQAKNIIRVWGREL